MSHKPNIIKGVKSQLNKKMLELIRAEEKNKKKDKRLVRLYKSRPRLRTVTK